MEFWVHDTKFKNLTPQKGGVLVKRIRDEHREGADFQMITPPQKLYEVAISSSEHFKTGDIVIPQLTGFKLVDDIGDEYYIIDDGRILAKLIE